MDSSITGELKQVKLQHETSCLRVSNNSGRLVTAVLIDGRLQKGNKNAMDFVYVVRKIILSSIYCYYLFHTN